MYANILVQRIKIALDHFVSPEQLGFVPGRQIGEATHLSKLIQAYLDDADEEGIILALDWEKAFDRCSWDYFHQALDALNFGPNYKKMITQLSNPRHPPKRRVKVNGTMSDPFTINCGVPQGCPFYPLAFLIIAEALTRFVKLSPTFTGMEIGDTEHRISQFADDTQLYLKNFSSLSHIWAILAPYTKEPKVCELTLTNL
jgi:hypothetical protein